MIKLIGKVSNHLALIGFIDTATNSNMKCNEFRCSKQYLVRGAVVKGFRTADLQQFSKLAANYSKRNGVTALGLDAIGKLRCVAKN